MSVRLLRLFSSLRNCNVGKVIDLSEDEKVVDLETSEESEESEEIDEVTKLQEKIEELEDQSLRLQAEIQNMRRRNQKDRELSARYQSQDLAKEILPVMDNLERALDTEVTDEAGKNLKQGVEMVLTSFKSALESAKVEEIVAEGKEFDPNFQEAIAQVPAEEGQESGVVTKVYEKGYKLHDRVLRAAKVIVTE